MNKKNLFFIFVLLSFNLIVYFSSSPWFIYFQKSMVFILSAFCIILFLFFKIKKIQQSKIVREIQFVYLEKPFLIPLLLVVSVLLMIFFPVRNLNLGDGVLLLEHVALEAKIFGYHLTMDEILEALIHSVLFANFSFLFPTPIEVYRFISTICGVFALGILFYYFRKFKITFAGYILVLSSGGMVLFHGYSENYTIITTILWFYILFAMESIRYGKNRNLQALLPLCLIASVLILLHLVSGYLIFSLIYLCYYFSDKGKFIRNAFFCTVFSLSILAPVFIYFTYFSNVRFDFSQTHITNPKFYPILKIISINHFRDILFCIIASSLLPFILLAYFYLFHKKFVWKILQRKELQFLLFVLFGFLVHGFLHYPQLGFPADWDLLAFYWTPIVFLSAFIFTEYQQLSGLIQKSKYLGNYKFIPFFIFVVIIFLLNAVYLSKSDTAKMLEFNKSLNRINRFSELEESKFLLEVKPDYKKFYLQVSFFLFESSERIEELKNLDLEKAMKLLAQNQSFKNELQENIGDVKMKWQKDFYNRMTKYHIEYLDFLKKE